MKAVHPMKKSFRKMALKEFHCNINLVYPSHKFFSFYDRFFYFKLRYTRYYLTDLRNQLSFRGQD